MSTCPSCIVYCDFGFCCGGASDDGGLECHAPPQQLLPPPPPPLPPCHGNTEVTTVVNATVQLPPPPPPPPCHGHTEVITTVVNAPTMQPPPPHPHVLVPYSTQLPPPVPAPPHPPRPPTITVYDTPPPLQVIVPRRQCVPPPPLPPAKAYDAGSCSPLPPVSKSTQLAKPDGDVPSSTRYQTDDDPSSFAPSMVVPTATKAPPTPPAASDVAPPRALQHPVQPSGRDFELGMEYYSQQHRRQGYFLMQGRRS